MTAVLAPNTVVRKKGSRCTSISEETSVRKLVNVTTHTLRGRLFKAEPFSTEVAVDVTGCDDMENSISFENRE